MRNLKKILALVLAMMMVLSMMVTANAAFVDADDITGKYTEAVDLLTGLGVIDGIKNADDTVSFNPKGILNRAQAAKIISYILTGDLEEVESIAASVDSPFSDLPSWAEPYVLYAYNEGVVVGDGNGKYSPSRELTGYEFGKMLLIAAGICDNDDFAKDWKTIVAAGLKEAGLWTGKDFALSKKLTREEACYLAFNAIMYGNETEVSQTQYVLVAVTESPAQPNAGVLFDSYAAAKAAAAGTYGVNYKIETILNIETVSEDSLYQTVFGGYSAYGVVTSTPENDTARVATKTTPDTFIAGDIEYVGYVGLDLIGHRVKVYYAYDYLGNKVAYSVADKATNVAEISGNYTKASALTAAVNGAGFKKGTYATAECYANYGSTAGSTPTFGEVSLIVISNSADLTVDYVISLNRTVEVITSVTSKTVNKEVVYTYTTNVDKYKSTEIVNDVELAKGDIIHVTSIGNDGDIFYVEKAEALTGDYAGSMQVAGGYYTYYALGDASYTAKKTQIDGAYNNVTYLSNINSLTVGNTYAYVLDDYGNVAAIWQVKGEDTTVGYAYLAAFGKAKTYDALGAETETLTAVLYYADGTSEVVALDTLTASGIFTGAEYGSQNATKDQSTEDPTGPAAVSIGGVYKVSTTKYGYLLSAPTANAIPSETYTIKNGSNIVGTDIYGNDDSITFFVDGTYTTNALTNTLVVTAVKGTAALANQDLAEGYYKTLNGTKLYTVGRLNGKYYGNVDVDVYYYDGTSVVANIGKTHTTLTYTVYLNGVETELSFTGRNEAMTALTTWTPKFVTVKADNSNIEVYTGTTQVVSGVVGGYYNGTLTVGDDTYYIRDNTAIFDMTYYEDFVAFDEEGMTIVVSMLYKADAAGLKEVSTVYVESVESNDASVEAVTKVDGIYTITVDSDITIVKGTGDGTLYVYDLNRVLGLADGASAYYWTAGKSDNDVVTELAKQHPAAKSIGNAAMKTTPVVCDCTMSIYVVAADGVTVNELNLKTAP